MTEGDPRAGWCEVRLLRFPLKLHQRATEHHEELMREFQLLALNEGKDVPRRLVDLIDELAARYSSASAPADAVRDAALERGEDSVDLTYVVPETAAEACVQLERMLDEADEFCRTDQLLTLAAPDDAVAFRRWYLGEFPAQIAGAAPTPWPGESVA